MTTIRPIRPSEAAAVTDLYLDACRLLAEHDDDWAVPRWEDIHRWVARTHETDDAVCLVALDGDGSIDGYLLASVAGHPAMPGVLGELEELFVRPGAGQRDRKKALVEAGIAWGRERNAGPIRSMVALGAPWTDEELAFWRELGFEHDQTLVTLYPGEARTGSSGEDPVLHEGSHHRHADLPGPGSSRSSGRLGGRRGNHPIGPHSRHRRCLSIPQAQ